MKPSTVEIFTALGRTKRCAQAWAQSQPEHDEALGQFIKELDQIGFELKNNVLVKARFRGSRHGGTMKGNLPEIVNCLMPAIALAELISERQPEYTVPLKRFQEEVQWVKRELIKKVYPGLLSDED